MKEKLVVESKGSVIGLIINTIVTSFIVVKILNNFIDSDYTVAVIPIIAIYFIYKYIFDKTVIKIHDDKIDITIIKAIPKKEDTYSYVLNNISAIKLVQTSNFIYGKKVIVIYDKKGDNDEIYVNVRYYQLVQLEKYLNEKCQIKTDLIG